MAVLYECQGYTSAFWAGMGVFRPSGMVPRWPPRALALRARTGTPLGTGKGRRSLRTQSRGVNSPATCRRRKNVSPGGVGLERLDERPFHMPASTCDRRDIMVSGVCSRLETRAGGRPRHT